MYSTNISAAQNCPLVSHHCAIVSFICIRPLLTAAEALTGRASWTSTTAYSSAVLEVVIGNIDRSIPHWIAAQVLIEPDPIRGYQP